MTDKRLILGATIAVAMAIVGTVRVQQVVGSLREDVTGLEHRLEATQTAPPLSPALNEPVPVTPRGSPLLHRPRCRWAAPGGGDVQAGGRLCYYRSPEKGTASINLRIGDACTERGIRHATVVLKVGGLTLSGDSTRGAAVSFLNVPAGARPRRAVQIITAAGYRTRVLAQRISPEVYIGSPNLIPLRGVALPRQCHKDFFSPRYLRRDEDEK